MKFVAKQYKNAWLIGASGGIGGSVLKILGEYSEKICACDITKKNILKQQRSIKYWRADCGDEKQLAQFAEEAIRDYGPPELMVIAAGYVSSLDLIKTSAEEIDKIYINNFKLVALMLKLFFEKCPKDINVSKNVVVISSIAGLETRPNQPIYAAMKSAIHSLIKSQAATWGKFNIKINVIAPGTVAVERNTSSLKEKYINFPLDPSRPLGRVAFPGDLHAACRLFFNAESLITGQILVIDGGSHLLT